MRTAAPPAPVEAQDTRPAPLARNRWESELAARRDRRSTPAALRPEMAETARDAGDATTAVPSQAGTDEEGTGATGEVASLDAADEVVAPPVAETAGIDAAAVPELPGGSSAATVLDSYADARPSQQAVLQPTLGPAMDAAVSNDATTFAAATTHIGVAVEGADIRPPVRQVAATAPAAAADLQPTAADPTVDLPSTAPITAFTGNDDLAASADRLPEGGGRAAAIESSLDSVVTAASKDRGPASEDLSEAPPFPWTGSADPAEIERSRTGAVARSEEGRATAAAAVLDGDGPEVAQPVTMHEQRAIKVSQPTVSNPVVTPESDVSALLAAPLTPDVVDQFDQDAGPRLTASLADARTMTRAAESERDGQRDAAVDAARAETRRLGEESAKEQTEVVGGARREIQAARQQTLDDQAEAVDQLNADAVEAGSKTRSDVDAHVEAEEAKIADDYEAKRREAAAAEAKGTRDAEAARAKAKAEAKDRSWWEKAVDFVKKAFAALTKVIGKILDGVRKTVGGLIDAARAFAKRVIDAAVTFVSTAIKALASVVSSLVTTLLGDVFPGLARVLNRAIAAAADTMTSAVQAVGERLKAGVDAAADGLQAGLDSIIGAFKAAIDAVAAVITAVLSGDWKAILRMALEAVLKLAGIDPQEFYAGLAQALEVIGTIIDQPGQFLANLLNALLGGVKAFGKNFLTHLQKGIIGWLTGALGGSVEIPETWNLAGVVNLIRSILGLTWEWIRSKAVRLVGEKNAARLEWLVEQVNVLREEGWTGFVTRIKEQLTGLAEQVLSSIKDLLVTKVIVAGLTWLAAVFNPVGAIVKIVKLVWDLYTFVRDQLARIAAIVRAIFGGIADIAHGVLGPAIAKVEETLGNLLPIAIDLVAKVIGLGSLAAPVRKLLTKVRARIDQAVDRLLDKILARFKGGAPAGAPTGAGPTAGAGTAAGTSTGELIAPVPVASSVDPGHKIHLVDRGTIADVVLRSAPLPVATWLTTFETARLPTLADNQQKTARKALKDARAALATADQAADRAAAANDAAASTGKGKGKAKAKAPAKPPPSPAELGALGTALAGPLATLMGYEPGGTHQANLAQTEPDARGTINTALVTATRADPAFAAYTWVQVRDTLAKSVPSIKQPLRSASAYGDAIQARMSAYIAKSLKAADLDPNGRGRLPDLQDDAGRRTALISDRVLPAVHGNDGLVARIRARMFLVTEADPWADITAAIRDAINHDSGDPTDPKLLEAVKKADGFLGFLKKLAVGTDPEPITVATWPTVYAANRTYIDSAFRTVGGKGGSHEWIPTSVLGQVIAHAQKQAATMPNAAIWVDFHHALRSPTDSLIFAPVGDYVKKVGGRPGGPLASRTFEVLQGHPGAVWAPLSESTWVDETKPQTKGSPNWHKELADDFEAASTMASKAGMQKLVNRVSSDFQHLIWDGSPTPALASFPSYRAAKGSTTDDLSFDQLRSRFVKQRVEGEKAIAAGQAIVDTVA